MRDESFGPVVGIMKVGSDEEAIRLMNDSPYGLTAAIWTRDVDAAERIGGEVETGTVFMNRCDYLDPGLTWTGVKDTGRGTRPVEARLRGADAAQKLSSAAAIDLRQAIIRCRCDRRHACRPAGILPPAIRE